jgi:hypothetical protein
LPVVPCASAASTSPSQTRRDLWKQQQQQNGHEKKKTNFLFWWNKNVSSSSSWMCKQQGLRSRVCVCVFVSNRKNLTIFFLFLGWNRKLMESISKSFIVCVCVCVCASIGAFETI